MSPVGRSFASKMENLDEGFWSRLNDFRNWVKKEKEKGSVRGDNKSEKSLAVDENENEWYDGDEQGWIDSQIAQRPEEQATQCASHHGKDLENSFDGPFVTSIYSLNKSRKGRNDQIVNEKDIDDWYDEIGSKEGAPNEILDSPEEQKKKWDEAVIHEVYNTDEINDDDEEDARTNSSSSSSILPPSFPSIVSQVRTPTPFFPPTSSNLRISTPPSPSSFRQFASPSSFFTPPPTSPPNHTLPTTAAPSSTLSPSPLPNSTTFTIEISNVPDNNNEILKGNGFDGIIKDLVAKFEQKLIEQTNFEIKQIGQIIKCFDEVFSQGLLLSQIQNHSNVFHFKRNRQEENHFKLQVKYNNNEIQTQIVPEQAKKMKVDKGC